MNPLNFQIHRPLHFIIAGQPQTGHLQIGPIEQLPSGKWACHWSISFIHPNPARLWGDDSLQALNRVLHFVGRLLRGSEDDGLIVWWQHKGDHAGFDDACFAPSTR